MQIVQVRGEAQSFDSTVDILLDVRSRVGDCATSSKHVKATLGGNWELHVSTIDGLLLGVAKLTEDLVTDIVLPDEVTKKLLVNSSLVDNGGIPEGTA